MRGCSLRAERSLCVDKWLHEGEGARKGRKFLLAFPSVGVGRSAPVSLPLPPLGCQLLLMRLPTSSTLVAEPLPGGRIQPLFSGPPKPKRYELTPGTSKHILPVSDIWKTGSYLEDRLEIGYQTKNLEIRLLSRKIGSLPGNQSPFPEDRLLSRKTGSLPGRQDLALGRPHL